MPEALFIPACGHGGPARFPAEIRRETSVRRVKTWSSEMESGTGVSANCTESDEPI
jgi:hypothetical protein